MKPHKIFSENIEGKALSQFYDAMKQDFVVSGALMPDAHAGYSLPIGAVVKTKDIVVPAWVGYDIGCGMCAIQVMNVTAEEVRLNAEYIYNQIAVAIPVGFNHNTKPTGWRDYKDFDKSAMLKEAFEKGDTGFRQLGTLGGGNHFIEIGADTDDNVWVIIHSGSRGIGHKCASHYMSVASSMATGVFKAKEGHFGLVGALAEGHSYRKDAYFCQEFALANRVEMLFRIEKILGHFAWTSLINRNHNHVEYQGNGDYIHRKGATHAELGMDGVIPGNMRDGSFIVRGLGNTDSLCSSSHGAGRVLGRRKAKDTLSVAEFEGEMKGIYANVGASTLDESPMAYKDIFQVMEEQKDLVEVITHVKPILNVKG